MEPIIAQIKSLSEGADEAGKKKILDQLRDLQFALETPADAIQRLIYLVSSTKLYEDLTQIINVI